LSTRRNSTTRSLREGTQEIRFERVGPLQEWQRTKAGVSQKQLEEFLGTEPLRWLQENIVLEPFIRLIEEGCDPQKLWNGLEGVRFAWIIENPHLKWIVKNPRFKKPRPRTSRSENPVAPEQENVPIQGFTFEGVMGFDRSRLKTVVNRMRRCACDLERLPISLLRQVLAQMLPYTDAVKGQATSSQGRNPTCPDLLAELRNLCKYQAEAPRRLRVLALAVEKATKGLRFQGRPLADQAIASVVCYVRQATGRLHNDEVSALIAAMTDRDSYDVVAHRDWRKRNRNLLKLR
jgi:hypothetical protein